MIPDEVVEEVRTRADIVGIVGESVSLKKSGREFKARCPFHEERTPSFYVHPGKNFYKCFGCGKSGDVFDFVMETHGMDFVEAVKFVGERSGVEVREVSRARPEDDPDRPLYEVTAFAGSWYREQLLDEHEGAEARAYLEGRGIGADTWERFGLGWAPDEWRAFREAAAKHGFDEQMMLELGLLKQSERSPEPYDGFRGRVVFPIEGMNRKVIGFGGRILSSDAKGPKYLNSPNSAIFDKGRNLYGLSWAKNAIRREECAVLVEGYLDVVSLVIHGFEHTVAQLGTGFTLEQARLLSRFTTRVLLLYDSDRAGLKATFSVADLLLEAGAHPAVVSLPEGEDPDTLVRSAGPDALQALMDDAIDVLDRKIQILEEKQWFSSIERRRSAVDRLLPTLRAVSDPTLRDIYVARVSEATGVRRETLEEEMARSRQDRSGRHGSSGPVRRVASSAPGARAPLPRMGAERQLLRLMVRGVDWVERAAELIAPEDFDDPYHRAIFRALLDEPELRGPPPGMDPVAARLFDEILDDPEALEHGIDLFTKSVNRIRGLALKQRLDDVQERIEAAEDHEEKLELVREKSRLASELREVDPTNWGSVGRPVDRNPNEPNR